MAYDPKNLSVLAYANGFTLWHYSTTDTAANTDTLGYFNDATEMVRVGDMILANLGPDANREAGIFLVSTNTGGNVNVANLTPVGNQNSD